MRQQAHRGSGARTSGNNGHDEDRLQQLLLRMRAALRLGLRPSSLRKEGVRWWNSDAQVQGQAVRAIAAFVAALPPRSFPLATLQGAIEEAVAALEYLLGSEPETIYKLAAGASAGLAGATQGHYMLRLLSPLAFLLSPSKTSLATASAAVAMQSILTTVRTRTADGKPVADDPVWKTLEDAGVLKNIIWRLDKKNSNGLVGVAECAEILAIILERWPVARYRVGQIEAVRSSLLALCMNSTEAVAVSALRACSALVLCAGVAVLQLQSGEPLWATLAHCLDHSRLSLINLEALRLLSLLGRLPSFNSSFRGPNVRAILEGCLRNLKDANKVCSSVEEKEAAVEAAHAVSVILSWPGEHHTTILELSLGKVLFRLLTEKDVLANTKTAEEPSGKHDADRRVRGTGKVTSSLWPILWEVVGHLAAHSDGQTKKASRSRNVSEAPVLDGLPGHACFLWCLSKVFTVQLLLVYLIQVEVAEEFICVPHWTSATLLRALHRNGQNHNGMHVEQLQEVGIGSEEQQMSNQELLKLCKAVFLLLSSPSQALSASAALSLKEALELHGHAWIPRLVDSLAVGHTSPSLVKPESLQTAANLFALACFSWLPNCQELLLQGTALDVVQAIINIYARSALTENRGPSAYGSKWSVSHARAGIAVKTCCEEIVEDWEGGHAVLLASLCAFSKLVQASIWARGVALSLSKGRLDGAKCFEGTQANIIGVLWTLAESTTVASSSVRWWAVSGLACFGIYGFPSALGRDLCQAFDDSFLTDLVFVLADGNRLHAHSIILSARCPSLLPKRVPYGVKENLEELVCPEVHLSDRISYGALKSLLEFVYSGVVHIELEEADTVRVLAKRCGLEPLTDLLYNRSPRWGLPPASCDLASALAAVGYPFVDIMLRGNPQIATTSGPLVVCGQNKECRVTVQHVHAHRVVLSTRCEYFQALFRSGMRDSMVDAVDIATSHESVQTLVYFWYTGKLRRLMQSQGWCAWNNLETHKQILYLQGLIELSQLVSQWLIFDFQEHCNRLVLQHLERFNLHLGPPILRHAAACKQWHLVEMCANCIAPAYTHLRDTGAFENLDEDLKDVLRTAHVHLAFAELHLQPG